MVYRELKNTHNNSTNANFSSEIPLPCPDHSKVETHKFNFLGILYKFKLIPSCPLSKNQTTDAHNKYEDQINLF